MKYNLPFSQRAFTLRVGGFTLTELLITVSIISIIVAASVISLNGSLKSARNHRRMADIESIHSALELYRQTNDNLPNETDRDSTFGNWETSCKLGSTFMEYLDPYINPIPLDSLNDCSSSGGGSFYAYYLYDAVSGEWTSNPARYFGCNFNGDLAIIAFRSFETDPQNPRTQAHCDNRLNPDPATCYTGSSSRIANTCRYWGNEFDYALMIRP
ncbi:MAG: seg [Microgenomates group bacterium GW2011_GWC1_41_8]|uniref:General secretion protein G n=3 Tax=Candidatus Roizmaniibacteriota TaxID=1752723 RepID=A0A0G0ZKP1_9BACT|nr:MAG: General secretion protein G [Candidatus Roizmanbacteria bacterium GW2011_GWB1_40_7]KKR91159.1 MAG: General secretion protein G [Candidatus Roizmanbacteria bacterium GW2011_GWA1_41_13]KKS22606.1 MAG: General secretion protein G [Candidatus Roizmanbacteria bacterium GW2011_GWC2_41_7]KKS23131.1 MAG: seg [Microgenomates group bacterium GW2011_GWC1_41_8]OGK49336.1 MAG: hypothetical protein A3A55_01095 [Candidatus Roizmanbacteria bacterium RIFCSPLOWO2_01_FULL_40_14]